MNSTRIKICGIKSVEIAEIAINAGAEVIGLIVEVPHSPRCLTVDEAETIVRGLPAQLMPVCVLQDPDPALAQRLPVTWVQLHGDEDDALVAQGDEFLSEPAGEYAGGLISDAERRYLLEGAREIDALRSRQKK